MRVALVATHHAEYASCLARALGREHEVLLVLSRRNAARQLAAETVAGLRKVLTLRIVPHHYAPLQPLVARLCARAVAGFAPDVVHVQEHPTWSMGMLAERLNGRWPLVTTVHDPEPHSGADARAAAPFVRWNERLRARSDGLIVHGERLVGPMAATQADGAERVRVLRHGVLGFGRLPEPVAGGEGLILFGRMNRYKGLDVLLDANDRWRAQGFSPRIVVAGEGPEIARWRARLEAAPNVELHGRRLPQDELAALVRSAAAAVLPYHDATGSGVAASALGAGKPVLASDVGALGEAVRDQVNGLLVSAGDAAALAEAGYRLLTEPGLLGRLGEGARAEAAIGWDMIAAETAQVYREAQARTAVTR